MISLDDADRHHRLPDSTSAARPGYTAEAAPDDAALMRLVQQGDERAFTALYDRVAPVLLAAILRIVPERRDAESILLETFMQAWRSAARYSEERSPVLAWLHMIARSRALDFSRSSARTLRLMPMSIDHAPNAALAAEGQSYNPSRRAEDEERGRIVASAMSSLTVPQRTAIELAFFEGLSHSEIAERLHEPLGTIKSRIRLAMARLRSVLHPSSRELAT